MVKYVVLNAGIEPVGIQGVYDSNLTLDDLGLSDSLKEKIEHWYFNYKKLMSIEDDNFRESTAHKYDGMGIELSEEMKIENSELKIDYYFSDYFAIQIWLNKK